ncbi:MAG TPA: GNAT family N-acetyltransferase [Streptosporangiaceae bacterium]|nr:GNAT family N-acetyltransferase [Streptosporangiaceae bacterium]
MRQRLIPAPRLMEPSGAVRESWLASERDSRALDGGPTDVLEQAEADFNRFVAARRGIRIMWGVPSTIWWYVSDEIYVGEIIIRHQLTPQLERSGGHIGYEVAPAWRRQGHATAMLAGALVECRRLGLTRVLLTCDAANEGSRRVILANGGVPDLRIDGEDRFWITLGGQGRRLS